MDASGHWLFYDFFGQGFDAGAAVLHQAGDSVTGSLVYCETIYGDDSLLVDSKVQGEWGKDKLFLKSVDCRVLDHPVEYIPDTRMGTMAADWCIVGFSGDDHGVEGRFLLRRCDYRA